MKTLREFLEHKEFHRIPLKRIETGHYRFSAKINSVEGNFILDTGASNSCVGLADSFLFDMKLEDSPIKAAGAGASNMETKISRNNTFRMGSKVIRTMEFILFDLSHVNYALEMAGEAPTQGIIGADFLKKQRAIIDYGRNCVYLKK